MRKETIIAILLGVGLGLIFTFGVYTANQAVKEKKTEQTVSVVETTPSPSPKANLVIDEPENNLVTAKNKIIIAGKSQPEAVIAVFSEENQLFSQADENGLFSLEMPLAAGSNQIVITSIDSENNKEEKILNIVYTTKLK